MEGLRPLLRSVTEAACLLGSSRSKIFQLMSTGELESVKLDCVKKLIAHHTAAIVIFGGKGPQGPRQREVRGRAPRLTEGQTGG
jgi:hypothetical protein